MIPIYPLRFRFRAIDALYFPPGKQGNVLRGAFGMLFRQVACTPDCLEAASCPLRAACPYARVFEPVLLAGPSGLADPPRPFVFRAMHLDGQYIAAGREFEFTLNLFFAEPWPIPYLVLAFSRLRIDGIGPGRGRAALEQVDCDGLEIFDGLMLRDEADLQPLIPQPDSRNAHQIRVDFLTPTELKGSAGLVRQPDFPTLFSRVRDRVANLASFYGGAPPSFDFEQLGRLARDVRTDIVDLHWEGAIERTSSRTGQTHRLGGFTGQAIYSGTLDPFLPFLATAQYTGVGRQTVWGKGEIRLTLDSQRTR